MKKKQRVTTEEWKPPVFSVELPHDVWFEDCAKGTAGYEQLKKQVSGSPAALWRFSVDIQAAILFPAPLI